MQDYNLKRVFYIFAVLMLLVISYIFYTQSDLNRVDTNMVPIVIMILISAFVVLLFFDYLFKSSNFTSKKAVEIANINSIITPYKSDITLSDVAGLEDVKEDIKEIVDFLKEPGKYRDFGIKLPKGLLLVGPPGVGKTMIAKAIAGESGLPFFYQSGASFVHVYVGMGAKRVKELFDSAKKQKSAIIFIDEIDAVGKSRGDTNSDERDATLNQLLVEMDGFDKESNIMVIGATNQIEVLDEALLRAGRFDRRIYIPLPNIKEREEILKLHLKKKNYHLDINRLALISTGYSSATLATWVNEAAIKALKRGAKSIEFEDFDSVKESVMVGKKREMILDDGEKKIQSSYQSAKIFCAYRFGYDFDKVTLLQKDIVDTKSNFQSKQYLFNLIKLYLSGDEANKIFFDESYTNAKDDIKKARELAKNVVDEYGMGESIIPSGTDIAQLLHTAQAEVNLMLKKDKQKIRKISEKLLEKEFIIKEDIKEILN